MSLKKNLTGTSFLHHKKPEKLIFMLHGYGDSADNFIHIVNPLDQLEWKANYIALNAPSPIFNYPQGRQWFDLYPNGIYITDAGSNEMEIIRKEILEGLRLIENTIKKTKDENNLSFKDCILLGFSQGGMMTFEFGNYFKENLAGLAILSGRIISEEKITNEALKKTPIFISHGSKDEVLPIKVFELSCMYLKKNDLAFESHNLNGDAHTISPRTIKLLQKFIKKNFMI